MDHILGFLSFEERAEGGAEEAPPRIKASARALQAGVGAALAALVIGALWGAAVGSVSPALAISNLYKVPMILLLSSLSALPLGLWAWRALAPERDLASFVIALAKGLFGGALVLGASAPLVALYSHTSASAGPLLAIGSVAVALAVGFVAFARAALRGADPSRRARYLAPVMICGVVQLAAALQLNVLAAPILPKPSLFAGGIDGLRAHVHESP